MNNERLPENLHARNSPSRVTVWKSGRIAGVAGSIGKGISVLDANVRDFLNEKRFAVLATISASGAAQQTVMWYELQGDRIMMNTAEGRVKASNFRRDPRVSICVEDEYRFVTITGKDELDEDREQALKDIHSLAVRYHGETQADKMLDGFRKDTRVTLYMSIDNVVTNGF